MRNRIASLVMCLCMFVTILPTAAWATDTSTDTESLQNVLGETGSENEQESSPSNENEQEPSPSNEDEQASPTSSPSNGEELMARALSAPRLGIAAVSGPVTLGEGVKMQVTHKDGSVATYSNFEAGWNAAVNDTTYGTTTTNVTLGADWKAEGYVFGSGEGFSFNVNHYGYINVPSGKNITLNLNGHTIDRALPGTFNNGFVIYIVAGGSLTLQDSVGTGKITGGNNSNGGGVYNNGTFTMKGGTITANKAINSNGGKGGGVYNYAGGTFTMSGDAEIASNTSTRCGGGVYNGIGTFKVSGAVQITGNKAGAEKTANNVYLYSDAVITVADALTSGASIGVTTQSSPTVDAPVSITAATNTDYASFFTSDVTGYACRNSGSGAAQVVQLEIPKSKVSLFDLANSITAPVTGGSPVANISCDQYTGSVSWSPVPTSTFGNATAYTAAVTLLPAANYTFDGVAANAFTYTGARSVTSTVADAYGKVTVTITFPATAPAAGQGYTIDYAAETISIDDGYEVSTSTDFTTTLTGGSSIQPGTTYYVRKAGGAYTANPFASRPATPDALAESDVTRGVDSMTIESTDAANQYGYAVGSGAITWLDVTAGALTIDNLTPGTSYNLFVRIKATDSAFHSEVSEALSVKTLATVNIPTIVGVTAPVGGAVPVTAITGEQYTGTVSWSPAPATTFAYATSYTATITLTEKPGYVFDESVTADFFTVAGATATNAAYAGGENIVVTAQFPATAAKPVVPTRPSHSYNPYFIISGVGQNYTGKVLVFRSNADYSDFLSVDVDGKTLTRGTQYGVRSGSTIVTLYNDFLKTLTPGVHTLNINSVGGSAGTTFTVGLNSAQTGDTGILLYAGMALLSLAGMGYVGKKRELF